MGLTGQGGEPAESLGESGQGNFCTAALEGALGRVNSKQVFAKVGNCMECHSSCSDVLS